MSRREKRGPVPPKPRAQVRSGPFQSSERAAKEPNRKPPNQWRNMWFLRCVVAFPDGTTAGPGKHVTSNVYPTAEIAEQKAMEILGGVHPVIFDLLGAVEYLRPIPAEDCK